MSSFKNKIFNLLSKNCLPLFPDKIHLGLEILIRTSKAAIANNTVESNTSRSTVTICYLNILLENKMEYNLPFLPLNHIRI